MLLQSQRHPTDTRPRRILVDTRNSLENWRDTESTEYTFNRRHCHHGQGNTTTPFLYSIHILLIVSRTVDTSDFVIVNTENRSKTSILLVPTSRVTIIHHLNIEGASKWAERCVMVGGCPLPSGNTGLRCLSSSVGSVRKNPSVSPPLNFFSSLVTGPSHLSKDF